MATAAPAKDGFERAVASGMIILARNTGLRLFFSSKSTG
jgi:hypothetical protein